MTNAETALIPEGPPAPRTAKQQASIETILREEVRSIRELWMRILQWGVTVMIAAGSIIFYARRAIKDDLVSLHVLKAGEPIPLSVFSIGTAFLILLAVVFSVLSGLASRRYRSYFDQLVRVANRGTGINDVVATGFSRWILPYIFWLFPIFDVLLRTYYFEIRLTP